MTGPRISLVIPAYNEARYLPRLLDSVDVARRRYGGAVEVIVGDNGSTDETARLAKGRGCIVAPVAKRAIAAARNGGARVATGEILCLVDADMRIHPDTFTAIDAAMRNDRVAGGSTGVTLERWSLGLAVTFAMILPLVWLTGFDTGVVFCRRADFERLGGYDESLRVAEDVAWLKLLWGDGRRRGRRLVRLRKVKAIASTRKFDEYGDWHYFRFIYEVPRLLLGRRGLTAFTDRYWYKPNR